MISLMFPRQEGITDADFPIYHLADRRHVPRALRAPAEQGALGDRGAESHQEDRRNHCHAAQEPGKDGGGKVRAARTLARGDDVLRARDPAAHGEIRPVPRPVRAGGHGEVPRTPHRARGQAAQMVRGAALRRDLLRRGGDVRALMALSPGCGLLRGAESRHRPARHVHRRLCAHLRDEDHGVEAPAGHPGAAAGDARPALRQRAGGPLVRQLAAEDHRPHAWPAHR